MDNLPRFIDLSFSPDHFFGDTIRQWMFNKVVGPEMLICGGLAGVSAGLWVVYKVNRLESRSAIDKVMRVLATTLGVILCGISFTLLNKTVIILSEMRPYS